MQKSRLWQLFEHLSTEELSELARFVHSPYFNQRKVVAWLFDLLHDCRVHLRILPDKAFLHRKLFPGQAYLDKRVRNAMSLLLQQIEQYLAIRSFQSNEQQFSLHIVRAYRERNLERHFHTAFKKSEHQHLQAPFRNAEFHQMDYQLEEERYLWLSRQNRSEELNLQQFSDDLDLSFLAQKLRQACLLLSHQAVYSTSYDFGLLSVIIERIPQGDYLDYPAIALYYYCYLALTQSDQEEHFHRFKTLLVEESEKFAMTEMLDLYLLATNYCIRRMNRGEKAFARIGLDIYREGLQKEILTSKGYLSRFTYRNIVTKALVCGEYDWVEQFMIQYKDQLAVEHRESTFSFNFARLEYERLNYNKALELLLQSDYKDLLLSLSAKTLASKVYYKLEAFDLLTSHIEAMQTFIRRKTQLTYHQENYLNYLSFLRKLIELPTWNKAAREQLKKQVELTPALAERQWLMGELEV